MSHEDHQPALLRFIRLYLEDRQAQRIRTLGEYLEIFADAQESVAEAFAELELAGGEPPSPPLANDDSHVGPYTLMGELGRGGQGVVHLAVDERLGRKVALKCLSGSGAWFETALARFRREAELVSRLDHPGICVVYDAGFAGRMAYIAMRHVEGETLARRIQRGLDAGKPPDASDVAFAIRVVESAARALHAAHEAGVVHRDVKPGNIMVLPSGDPVLLDFGLAQDLTSTTLTGSGCGVGTPAYMAPEQIQGGSGVHDRRVDVYALGAVLYEAATRRRPHERANREALFRAILDDEASDPRLLNRAISRDLSVVISTATSKRPDARYPTALALAEDLRRVREHEPIRARPTPSLTRLLRWAQRNPPAAASLSAAILVLVVGLATTLAWWREAEARGRDLLSEKAAAAPLQYSAALAAALAAHEAGDDVSAGRFLRSTPVDLRGFEWEWLNGSVNRAVRVVRPPGAGQAVLVDGSPGTGLIARTADGSLVRVDPDDPAFESAVTDDLASTRVIATADLADALVTADPVRMVEVRSGRTRWTRADLAGIEALGITRDGLLVAAYGRDRRFVALDGRTGETVHESRVDHDPVARITFDAAGTRCLVSGGTTARLMRVTDWSEIWRSTAPYASFIGRGTLITAVGSAEATISRIDVTTGTTTWTSRDTTAVPAAIDADDHGDSLFAIGSAGVLRLDAASGVRISRLCAPQDGAVCVRFLPELGGVFVGASDGSIRIFDPRTGPEVRAVPLHADGVFASAPSPDGHAFACAGWGSIRVVDAATGALKSCDYVSEDLFQAVAWSGDGAYVFASGVRGGLYRMTPGGDPTGRIRAPTRESATALAVAPDGSGVCAGLAGGAIIAFDSRIERRATRFAGHRSAIRAMAFDPSGRVLASGSGGGGAFAGTTMPIPDGERDSTVRLWDANSGDALRELRGHRATVRAIAWSHDGSRLASADASGVVIVWDASSGAQLGARRVATPSAASAVFSVDDDRLAVGFEDGAVCILDVRLEREPLRLRAAGLAPVSLVWTRRNLSASGGALGLAAFDAGAPASGCAACDLVERAARLIVTQPAASQVTSDALERGLLACTTAPPEIRAAAAARARIAGDHPSMLNNLAWGAALHPGRSQEELLAGRAAALSAIRSRPDSWGLRNTLALVEYRLGNFDAAFLATEEGFKLRGKDAVALGADLVIQAMVKLRQGARDSGLERLDAAKRAPDRSEPDVQRLIIEAEELGSKP